MSIIDLLFNAAGGGILGSALHCFTDWLDTKNKIALMNAQTASAEKTEAFKAFAASQASSLSSFPEIPDGVWTWVKSIVALGYGITVTLKEATRPALAWMGVGLLVYVYSLSSPVARETLANEYQFGAFTAIFWYFGARYSRNQK